ncbi:MAG: VOC family protein [Rhodobacteraceae bacterium]|nr:VOC family protein [Paracoccaceae bacterium]
MAKPRKGKPCWYELSAPDARAAAGFYGHVMGWKVQDAGMPGFDYLLAKAGDNMVAGMMSAPDMPTFWMIYFSVLDCDKAAKAIAKAGGNIHREPTDIPGTGRFAIVTDPQGAVFGILAPADSDAGEAFKPMAAGHGRWHELMTSDPEDALAFYSKQFGWKAGDAMPMGPGMTYQMFRHAKTDIGGMMKQMPGMPGPGTPFWLPYFSTDGVEAAMVRIAEAGGRTLHGPQEVPGGVFIAVNRDPAGALFALVGPK